jgi:hypothetical protein
LQSFSRQKREGHRPQLKGKGKNRRRAVPLLMDFFLNEAQKFWQIGSIMLKPMVFRILQEGYGL